MFRVLSRANSVNQHFFYSSGITLKVSEKVNVGNFCVQTSLISTEFDGFTSPFVPVVFVSIKKIYQTLGTVFHPLSKHLTFTQTYSATRRIFNSRLGVDIPRKDGLLCSIQVPLKSM